MYEYSIIHPITHTGHRLEELRDAPIEKLGYNSTELTPRWNPFHTSLLPLDDRISRWVERWKVGGAQLNMDLADYYDDVVATDMRGR